MKTNMKTKKNLMLLLSVLLIGGMYAKNEKAMFKVAMDCNSCKQKIEKNIAFEKGVKALDVNLEKQCVEIMYNDEKTDKVKLQKSFEKIGYKAELVVAKVCCSDKSTTTCKDTCKSDKKEKETCNTSCCAKK